MIKLGPSTLWPRGERGENGICWVPTQPAHLRHDLDVPGLHDGQVRRRFSRLVRPGRVSPTLEQRVDELAGGLDPIDVVPVDSQVERCLLTDRVLKVNW